jgi:hypothetical protein
MLQNGKVVDRPGYMLDLEEDESGSWRAIDDRLSPRFGWPTGIGSQVVNLARIALCAAGA